MVYVTDDLDKVGSATEKTAKFLALKILKFLAVLLQHLPALLFP